MKKLSIFLIIIIAVLAILSTISCSEKTSTVTSSQTQTVTTTVKPTILRWSSPFPPVAQYVLKPQEMAKRFSDRTGGKYQIEVYAGEQLTKVMEHLDAVRMGSVEMAVGPMGPMEAVDPRFYASEFPFLYNNAEACAAASESLLPMFNQIVESNHNQKALASWASGALELLSNKQVKTIEDASGLLMQSVSPLTADVISKLGSSAVPIPFTESYQALEKGVVDGGFWVLEFVLEAKMQEVVKYLTPSYYMPSMHLLTINMDTWKSLPKDVQDILVDECQKLNRELNDYGIKAEADNTNKLVEFGMELYRLPKAERDRWITKLEPFRQELLSQMTADNFGQKMMEIAEKANSNFPYSY